MAFDPKVFSTRAKSALVYVAVMLTGLLWNEMSFFILFSVVHFGTWFEYLKLSQKTHPNFSMEPWWKKIHFPLLGWGWMLMNTSHAFYIGNLLISMLGEWLIRISLLGIVLNFVFEKRFRQVDFFIFLKGFLYLSVSLALLVHLRSGWLWNADENESFFATLLSSFNGKLMCLLIVFGIWINDTMAYLVGSFIGKTPLSKWSPKKSWEGTIGGIFLSVGLINLVAATFWHSSAEMIFISFVVAISGTLGDLYESKLKRLAGVKDSGRLMPGHGGFLDRFDSILFASPAVWLVCYLLYR